MGHLCSKEEEKPITIGSPKKDEINDNVKLAAITTLTPGVASPIVVLLI